jgi:hypothetical protein
MPLPTVKAERTVEIRLDEEPIRIAYRISFGATLAAEERKAADRDADSAISASEGNSRLDQRTDELLAALEICTGTTLETLVCKKLGRREVERVEAEGWEPDASGHLHLSWTLALPQRAKEIGAIRVDDAWEVPGVEVSDVAILPPKHAVLELAGEAGRSSGVASHISWIEQRRQPGVRSVVAVWPAPRPSSRRKIALIVAIAALLAAGGFWASRRRSS